MQAPPLAWPTPPLARPTQSVPSALPRFSLSSPIFAAIRGALPKTPSSAKEILALLDFIDLDHCIDCNKGKYVTHIKKSGATRSSGVLEIIHIDICGPFNVRFVDDFNSFITFMNDFSRYGYIYPIFIQYVSDPMRLISLKYLRLKFKISIMLKLK
jgi:hypothetical protein